MEWTPLLVALIVALGGAFGYWNQKRIDHRIDFNREKREIYRHYLASVRTLERRATRSGFPDIKAARREALDDYLGAHSQLSIFAPDGVKAEVDRFCEVFEQYTQALIDFYEKQEGSRGDVDLLKRNFHEAHDRVVDAMRVDLGASRTS